MNNIQEKAIDFFCTAAKDESIEELVLYLKPSEEITRKIIEKLSSQFSDEKKSAILFLLNYMKCEFNYDIDISQGEPCSYGRKICDGGCGLSEDLSCSMNYRDWRVPIHREYVVGSYFLHELTLAVLSEMKHVEQKQKKALGREDYCSTR